MDNEQFIRRVNRILAARGAALPVLDAGSTDSTAVAAWAGFLRECVRSGIQLSDARWRRLRVVRTSPVTELALESEENAAHDEEFKVGLQLLVGLLSGKPPR